VGGSHGKPSPFGVIMPSRNVENILSVYRQALPFEVKQGLEWYRTAHSEACRLSQYVQDTGFELPYVRVSAIIAALSPGLRWERNIEAAERTICGKSLDGLGVRWYAGVRKAGRILQGESPAMVLGANNTQYQKVPSFWECISEPDTTDSVCVDGHAYAIWTGKRVNLDDTPPLGVGGLYGRIATDYRHAAREVGLRPCQLQAITWCTWRRLHNVVRSLPLLDSLAA